ncbi:recombinase family protein [Propionivibrio sp.]|uniref:recombinase family protein n=1 Tax=Propionivibrio sp. TaxID=2212460 RepID=UPI003BF3C366
MRKESKPDGTAKKCVASIYACHRLSSRPKGLTAEQHDNSIESQILRCHEIAVRLGASVLDAQIYTDLLVSGPKTERSRRSGFDKLHAAIEAGGIALLVVDGVSRLSRDFAEVVKFGALMASHGVRMITTDGLDNTTLALPLQFSLIGEMARIHLYECAQRVKYGHRTALERGWMVTRPPFGYRAQKSVDSKGCYESTYWSIQPDEADVIRLIYQWRQQGQSCAQIANALNGAGIAPGRWKNTTKPRKCLPVAVNRILANPIYAGQFVYRVRTAGLDQPAEAGLGVAEATSYPRPQLSIVSKSLWAMCNERQENRAGCGTGTAEHLKSKE